MTVQHDEPTTKEDLDQLRQELVAKIDANGMKIDANSAKIDANGRKIDANGAKIDANGKKIDANSAKIDANGAKIDDVEKRLSAKIDANSATLSRVSHQVVDNHEQIGRLLSMSEKFQEYFDEIISSLDGLAKSVSRGDQERTAMNARLGRGEEDVDKHETDIKKIKTELAMP